MSFSSRIRRRETPFYDRLYRVGKAARGWEVPSYPPFWRLMYKERSVRITAWRNLWRIFYYEPMFRAQCVRGGKGLWLEGFPLPMILGTPQIEFGENFHISAQVTIAAHKNAPRPRLVFGDDCAIGNGCMFAIGSEVIFGDRVFISPRTYIAGYDGHPLDPVARRENLPDEVPPPIRVGNDVWIASGSMIHKGVTIGDEAVVAARSVVTTDVPAGALVAGIPARVIREKVNKGREDIISEMSREESQRTK